MVMVKNQKAHGVPGMNLSLQLYHRHMEHWVVTKKTAKVTVGKGFFLHKGEERSFISNSISMFRS